MGGEEEATALPECSTQRLLLTSPASPLRVGAATSLALLTHPSAKTRSASYWSLYDAVSSEDATSMCTLSAFGVPHELGVRTCNGGVGKTKESDDESPCPPTSALWLEVPLPIVSLRGEAEVAHAAATLCVASWCGCATDVLFVVDVESPNVADVPGEADEELAIARMRSSNSILDWAQVKSVSSKCKFTVRRPPRKPSVAG